MKHVLIALALALATGCARRQPAPEAAPGEPVQHVVTEADVALEVAIAHYAALEAGDRPAFEATCFESSSTQFWWTAGRKMVEAHGVRWDYERTEPASGGYKIFFRRIQPDGSQRGMPVPCTLKPEGGRWLVYTSTQ